MCVAEDQRYTSVQDTPNTMDLGQLQETDAIIHG
jgi:hypothetical protein